jgi:hypothetical protein
MIDDWRLTIHCMMVIGALAIRIGRFDDGLID